MMKEKWLGLFIVFTATALTGAAENQQGALHAGLVTRWGKAVTPETVWAEYPRPQLVRPEWKNLNGLWDYALLSKTAPAPTAYQGQILVPFCMESALSGVGKTVRPDERIWYRRIFEVPAGWAGKRVILNRSLDWETVVGQRFWVGAQGRL